MTSRVRLRDRDIREPLFDFLEQTFGKVRIIEEKMMGRSRADVIMVIDDALVGIEIKSDADTYVRLARQVRDYERYYDYNYVVVGTSHAMHIEEHVPETWGIITVEMEDTGCESEEAGRSEDEGWGAHESGVDSADGGHIISGIGTHPASGGVRELDFYMLRKAVRNPKMDMAKKIRILWRPELARIQTQNGMPAYRQMSKQFVRDKIVERVPAELLNRQISEELFERDYTTIESELKQYRGHIKKRRNARRRRTE